MSDTQTEQPTAESEIATAPAPADEPAAQDEAVQAEPVDEVVAAEAEVARLRDVFEEAQAFADEAKAARDEAQAALDKAIIAARGPVHPHQDMIDRMTYIRAQAEQRAARHGIALKLREAVPELADLDSRSAIDKAMKGSRQRGQSRPKIDKAAS